jgi:hypothetical protein
MKAVVMVGSCSLGGRVAVKTEISSISHRQQTPNEIEDGYRESEFSASSAFALVCLVLVQWPAMPLPALLSRCHQCVFRKRCQHTWAPTAKDTCGNCAR